MSLEPDVHTRISLIGTAERLRAGDHDEAVAELRRIAGKRADLLADAAGHFLGADLWNSAECYQLLVDAGASDQERIDAAAETVRYNRSRMGHTSEGTQSRRPVL